MISKKEALDIALKILEEKSVEYSSIDKEDDVRFKSKADLSSPIPFGKYKGQKINIYMVTYGEIWGLEERTMGIDINAETGEPLYIITPHGFEELE
ncbi:hypothetical protein D1818_18090 [Aquimarina sp. BL5]|uniref:hypothetical protein n=1 Tax=Aquimarina sp. BL5 TaxID=1714860 RepID=UPI000E496D25|nr:hypothetical protein [Aquimarina sp. BL5]AXT52651.1 hypothetical protein D1818_18090 [Aquimarina sp. BL5]RKN11715.1 hypothetical protein D7036_00790 [Aquimarina sp. BL5]